MYHAVPCWVMSRVLLYADIRYPSVLDLRLAARVSKAATVCDPIYKLCLPINYLRPLCVWSLVLLAQVRAWGPVSHSACSQMWENTWSENDCSNANPKSDHSIVPCTASRCSEWCVLLCWGNMTPALAALVLRPSPPSRCRSMQWRYRHAYRVWYLVCVVPMETWLGVAHQCAVSSHRVESRYGVRTCALGWGGGGKAVDVLNPA